MKSLPVCLSKVSQNPAFYLKSDRILSCRHFAHLEQLIKCFAHFETSNEHFAQFEQMNEHFYHIKGIQHFIYYEF